MTQTVRATARCQFCNWKARATGDNVVEIGTFLRRLCLEHTEREHADRLRQEVLDAIPTEEDDTCDSSK